MLDLFEGMWVEWDVEKTGIPYGLGQVRGLATTEIATIGRMVIVEPFLTGDEEMEFSCMVVPEVHLRPED